MVKKWNYRAERVKYSLFWLRFPEVMEFSIKRSVAQLLCPVFQYKSRPPCGAVWSGLSGREKRGRSKVKGGGQEAEGRRGRRKALVKLDLCEAFLPWYKSNNRGSGVRFSAFFYEWSLPPAKTTYSPRSDSFFFFSSFKRQFENFCWTSRPLSHNLCLPDISFPFFGLASREKGRRGFSQSFKLDSVNLQSWIIVELVQLFYPGS